MDRHNPHSQSTYESFRTDFPKWLAGFRGLRTLEVAIPTPDKPGSNGWSALRAKLKSYDELVGGKSKLARVELDTYSRFIIPNYFQNARRSPICESIYDLLASGRDFDEDLVLVWSWRAEVGKLMDWSNLPIERLMV
jgi:hypothetical protein